MGAPPAFIVPSRLRTKVLDFGISKLIARDTTTAQTALTGAQVTLGSPHYIAPEQLLDAAAADARSDVWSLGVVLHEALTGKPPYDGASTAEVCAKVLAGRLRPMTDTRSDVPSTLLHILARCLGRDLERRYQSVEELARDLRAARAALRE